MTQSREPNSKEHTQNYSFDRNQEEKMVNSPMPPQEINEKPKEDFKNGINWDNLEKVIENSDFNMPEKALQCRMKKITKIKGNKRIKTIRRVFKMQDGSEEVHEDIIVDRI